MILMERGEEEINIFSKHLPNDGTTFLISPFEAENMVWTLVLTNAQRAIHEVVELYRGGKDKNTRYDYQHDIAID